MTRPQKQVNVGAASAGREPGFIPPHQQLGFTILALLLHIIALPLTVPLLLTHPLHLPSWLTSRLITSPPTSSPYTPQPSPIPPTLPLPSPPPKTRDIGGLNVPCRPPAEPWSPITMSTPSLSDGQLTPTDTDPDLCFSSSEDDQLWPTAQDVAEMAIMIHGSAVPLSWSRETLKRLPPGTRPLRLVGEGAANVVFELDIPEGFSWAHEFKGTTSASPLSHSRLTRV